MKCPECETENTLDSQFCKKCARPLISTDDAQVFHTRTLETPRAELSTGSTFAGRYQIIEELGKGGMGKVYKAIDKKVNEKIALKLIKPEIAADKKTIERFSNELRFARKIGHRNVCRMYELMEDKGSHFITMEYVSGQDLKKLIRQTGQLTIGKAITVAKQVCEGLSEAHRQGVIHRDLKPNNIMIDRDGNARIMDFGVARSLKGKSITGAGAMIGTPEYMSPEQVEGKDVDQRTDIYSLGIILYEMLAGRLPFEGDTPFTIGVKQKSEEPEDPKKYNPRIPDDLSRLILNCLEKEREDRPQSTDEVCSALSQIEQGIPTTEREITPKKPLTSKEITLTFGLKKTLVPALVLCALLIVLALVIWKPFSQKETVPVLERRVSIAVISFENQTGDTAFDHLKKVIPNLLITSLEQSQYFSVMTWERMSDLLKQKGKADSDLIDRELGFELCQMDGVDTIVLGSFAKAGEMFATDVKVLNVVTKELLKSASSKGEGQGSIIKTQIDELSKEISRGVGISESSIESSQQRIADFTTSSIEAYNAYFKGWEAAKKFYYEEAQQFLLKALEIDPTFAEAYSSLGWVYGVIGETTAQRDAWEKAKLFANKATEKERLYIESGYAYYIENDPEKALRMLTQLAARYPKEKDAHHTLGWYYQRIGFLEEAIKEYEKVLELDPNYGISLNQLGYIYLDLKDFNKAIEYFQKYAAVSLGDANPIDSMAEVYFHMGKLDEAIRKYQEVLAIKPDFGSSWALGYIYAIKEDYAQSVKWMDHYIAVNSSQGRKIPGYLFKIFLSAWLGNLNQALQGIHMMYEIAEKEDNEFFKSTVCISRAWVHYERGEFELCQKFARYWLESIKNLDPDNFSGFNAEYIFLLGLIDLKCNQLDAASSKLTELESLKADIIPAFENRYTFLCDFLRGEISLIKDSGIEATSTWENVALLNIPRVSSTTADLISYNLPFLQDGLAFAYLKNGDIDKAIDVYEQLTTFDPQSNDRHLIYPLYYYRLGMLYEQKGMNDKAKSNYEKFLALWIDADPGRAEIEDTRMRLAGLQNR